MAIAFVQVSSVATGSSLGSSGTFTVGLTGVGAGNALFLLYAGTDGGGTSGGDLSNVSDGVNTWNNPTGDGDSLGNQGHTSSIIYSAYSVASGNPTVTLTAKPAASALYAAAVLLEFSGVLGLDSAGVAQNHGNSTGPVQAAGSVLSNAGDLVLIAAAVNAAVSMTTPASWTSEGLASSFPSYGFAYYLPGSTSALSPSYGSIAANNWAIAMSAYTPAGAGGGNSGSIAWVT